MWHQRFFFLRQVFKGQSQSPYLSDMIYMHNMQHKWNNSYLGHSVLSSLVAFQSYAWSLQWNSSFLSFRLCCFISKHCWNNTNSNIAIFLGFISHLASVNFKSCLLFFLSGIGLWQVKEVFTEYGSPSCKIDANLLKIHRWSGCTMAKCGCKWEKEKLTLSWQINLSCSLQLINTTAYQKSCFIANNGNYCIQFYPQLPVWLL